MKCPNDKSEMILNGNKWECSKCSYSTPDMTQKKKYDGVKVDFKELRSKIWNMLINVSKDDELSQKYEESLNSFLSNFHNYSFYNCFWLMFQRSDISLVNSRKRWEVMGRKIKENENPLSVLAPKKWEKEVEKEDGTKEVIKRLFFNPVPVFDVSQTEGEELQVASYKKLETEEDVDTLYATLKAKIEAKYPVVEVPMNPTCGGSTDGKGIKINSIRPVSSRICTLFHETAHIVHEHVGSEISSKDRELEAEISAFLVGLSYGIPKGSFDYVASWSKKDPESITDNVIKNAVKGAEALKKVFGAKEASIKL